MIDRDYAQATMITRLVAGSLLANGITLPKPEQERTGPVIWLAAFFVMVGLSVGGGRCR